MNHKIEINNTGAKFTATLWEIDLLQRHPDNTIDQVEANSYSELQVEIGNKDWHNLLNKNI